MAEYNPTCLGAYESVLRHPSSLYQALTEGLVLFAVLYWFSATARPRAVVTGLFLFLYAAMRTFTELFREPDAHLGLLNLGLSMGQWLSIPMALGGIVLMLWGFSQSKLAPMGVVGETAVMPAVTPGAAASHATAATTRGATPGAAPGVKDNASKSRRKNRKKRGK